MSISIKTIQEASRAQWLDYARNCATATFFHTPMWFEAFQVQAPGRIRPGARLVEFDDGRKALLPLCIDRRLNGLLKTWISSPGGTYGGWLSRDELTRAHTEALVQYVTSFRNVFWRENPYDATLSEYDIPQSIHDVSQIIALDKQPGDYLTNAPHAHRKAVKKAAFNEVTIRQATCGQDWSNHYRAYLASVKRWQEKKLTISTVYTMEFFGQLALLPSDTCQLWIAEKKANYLAGVICLYWNTYAVAWHGAAWEASFDLRPNNLLYAAMIRDAAQKKFSVFDMNPCRGLEGVSQFKKLLGATELRSRYVNKCSGIKRLGQVVKTIVDS
ncbi:MAG: GNAT family N-acetyltransferase [Chitinivibrionales bacterium]|nr:GNAT family N-acetyltransferase [Chitinivibrionales bacterium]